MKVMPSGLGMWLWKESQCEHGDWNKIISRCKAAGVKWIAIKSGDSERYPGWTSAHIKEVIQLCHNSGILFLTWNYSIPSTWAHQVVQIQSLFADGVDGHIIDAEIEWQVAANSDATAESFMQTLRLACGDVFIAHAPFAIVDYHAPFPYKSFGKYVDAVMPQSYWTEFNWTVENTIIQTDRSWTNFNATNPLSAKPVWPIGVTYGRGYPGVQGTLNAADIKTFLAHYSNVPVSLYSYDAAMGFPTWDVLDELAGSTIQSIPTKLNWFDVVVNFFKTLLHIK